MGDEIEAEGFPEIVFAFRSVKVLDSSVIFRLNSTPFIAIFGMGLITTMIFEWLILILRRLVVLIERF